jgi:hypothetical protein
MDPTGHSAAELEEAFTAHFAEVERITREADWAAYAEEFTADAVYVEHAFGEMRGRDEIRAWAVKTMSTFPGNVMTGFPIAWKVLDPPTSRIVCEVRNLMPDPGDGSTLEEPNITILTYAGDGLWSRQEDVYNPLRFAALAKRWAAVAAAHGNLPEDAAPYLG